MKKKLISLILATCMTGALLAGCGEKEPAANDNAASNDASSSEVADTDASTDGDAAADASSEDAAAEWDTSEHVVLTMYCIGDEGGIYADDHLAKVNEVLTEKINAEIKPIMVSWGDYKTKLPMVWASGEAYDLTYTANWVSYFDEAGKGAFMDITELFPAYAPKTYAELEGLGKLDTTMVDGKLFMVPNNIPDYTTFVYNYREDLRKKYNCAEIVDEETLKAYMQTIAENEEGMLPFNMEGGAAFPFQTWLNEMDWARPIEYNNAGLFTYDLEDPTKVFNLVETPEYEAFLKKQREYYEAGFWSQSIMAETTACKDQFLTGKSAVYLGNFSNSNGVYQEITASQPDWEIGIYSSDLASGVTESIAASNNGVAIGAYSKNPERAMMFVELMNQDEELYHVLMDGLEGITFEADYDKMVKWVPEGTDPTTTNLRNLGMQFGNEKFYLGSLNDSPIVNELKEKYAECIVFPGLSGFSINQDAISADLAALKSICDEYKVPLEKGVVDPETGLAELREKLKAANVDKVMEEINNQIAAYLAQ